MAVKASLQLILKANNVVVAKSSNSAVWQQSLALITGSTKLPPLPPGGNPSSASGASNKGKPARSKPAPPDETFATDLNVDVAAVQRRVNLPPPYLISSSGKDLKRHTSPED